MTKPKMASCWILMTSLILLVTATDNTEVTKQSLRTSLRTLVLMTSHVERQAAVPIDDHEPEAIVEKPTSVSTPLEKTHAPSEEKIQPVTNIDSGSNNTTTDGYEISNVKPLSSILPDLQMEQQNGSELLHNALVSPTTSHMMEYANTNNDTAKTSDINSGDLHVDMLNGSDSDVWVEKINYTFDGDVVESVVNLSTVNKDVSEDVIGNINPTLNDSFTISTSSAGYIGPDQEILNDTSFSEISENSDTQTSQSLQDGSTTINITESVEKDGNLSDFQQVEQSSDPEIQTIFDIVKDSSQTTLPYGAGFHQSEETKSTDKLVTMEANINSSKSENDSTSSVAESLDALGHYDYDPSWDDNTSIEGNTSMAATDGINNDTVHVVHGENNARSNDTNTTEANTYSNLDPLQNDEYWLSSNDTSSTNYETYNYPLTNDSEVLLSGSGFFYDTELVDWDDPAVSTTQRKDSGSTEYVHDTIDSSSGYELSGSGMENVEHFSGYVNDVQQSDTLYDDEDYTSSGFFEEKGSSGSGMDGFYHASGHMGKDVVQDDEGYEGDDLEDTFSGAEGYYSSSGSDALISGSGDILRGSPSDDEDDISTSHSIVIRKMPMPSTSQLNLNSKGHQHRTKVNVTTDSSYFSATAKTRISDSKRLESTDYIVSADSKSTDAVERTDLTLGVLVEDEVPDLLEVPGLSEVPNEPESDSTIVLERSKRSVQESSQSLSIGRKSPMCAIFLFKKFCI